MRKHLLLGALALILPLALPAQQIVKGRIENAPQHKTYMPTFKSDGDTKYPKNIILMIGDGTGLAHIASGYYANGGQLTVTNLKACGWVTTQSADAFTTDSAASGTAYACGITEGNCDKWFFHEFASYQKTVGLYCQQSFVIFRSCVLFRTRCLRSR